MNESPRRTRSGTEKRQRTKVVHVRCTEGEHAVLSTQADRAGMTIGALVRLKAIGTPGPRAMRSPPVNFKLLGQTIGQLGRCGSNLNQIARALNSGEAMPPGLMEALEEIRAASRALIEATGRKRRE